MDGMNRSPIQIKNYQFSVSIVKLYRKLMEQNEFIISRQVLRSGTSIGANVEEAVGAQSRKDFYMKMTIAFKEAKESHYWLRLLKDCQFIEQELVDALILQVTELLKILTTIRRTVKQNQNKPNLK